MKKNYLPPLFLTLAFLGNPAMGTSEREYLESFDLKDLELVRVETGKCSWALIKTPDGFMHYAVELNYLGKNFGSIDGIFEDKIRITELIEDGKENWVGRTVFLRVKPNSPVKERRQEFLETFDLKDLKVHWIETGECSWASIKAPNGHGYRARLGNYVGRNKGEIIKITNDGIFVREHKELGQGRSEKKTVFLKKQRIDWMEIADPNEKPEDNRINSEGCNVENENLQRGNNSSGSR